MKINFKMGEWLDDLIWCPSQCYYGVADRYGQKYVLYLRWRWHDPWSGNILVLDDNDKPIGGWSFKDLFEERGFFFNDEELDEAKAAIIEIWEEMYDS